MDEVNCGESENNLWYCGYAKIDDCYSTKGAEAACSGPSLKCRFRSITTV